MAIFVIINIDEDVDQINHDKDVKRFSKNLINISLESCQCIYQSKKHYLILKVAIPCLKRDLSFVSLADSH